MTPLMHYWLMIGIQRERPKSCVRRSSSRYILYRVVYYCSEENYYTLPGMAIYDMMYINKCVLIQHTHRYQCVPNLTMSDIGRRLWFSDLLLADCNGMNAYVRRLAWKNEHVRKAAGLQTHSKQFLARICVFFCIFGGTYPESQSGRNKM